MAQGLLGGLSLAGNRHRLPRQVVEPPSLEIFQSHLGTILSNIFYSLSREVEQDDLQCSLPTLTILRFCDTVKRLTVKTEDASRDLTTEMV